jgi:hypothetical protein
MQPAPALRRVVARYLVAVAQWVAATQQVEIPRQAAPHPLQSAEQKQLRSVNRRHGYGNEWWKLERDPHQVGLEPRWARDQRNLQRRLPSKLVEPNSVNSVLFNSNRHEYPAVYQYYVSEHSRY